MPSTPIPAPVFRGPEAAKRAAKAGPVSVEATRLYGEILACTARLRDHQDRHQGAVDAMRQAEQALHQQVQQVEYNAEAETAKGGDLEAARVAADPNLHLSRVAAEDSRLREAVESYHRFAFVHAHDLIAELTRGAEVRTEELARVRAAAHEPENAYHDVKGSIQTVVDLVRGPRPAGPLPGETENMFGFDAASAEMVAWSKWSLPLDESVPLPPAEVLAAHAALYAPEVTS